LRLVGGELSIATAPSGTSIAEIMLGRHVDDCLSNELRRVYLDAREPQENQELVFLAALDDDAGFPELVSGENRKCSYKPTSMDVK
jgi:hypothetical protein